MQEQAKINPTLLFSVLCDDVRREDNGKFILLGLFEKIGAVKFPVRHPTLYVMNCWCSGIGKFSQNTRILKADGSVLAEDKKTEFALKDLKSKHRVVARFNNLLFEKPGEYSVEVTLDDDLKVRYPLIIQQITPPQPYKTP